MFEGGEFVNEILENPKPGAPLGYEKIDNSYNIFYLDDVNSIKVKCVYIRREKSI